MSREIRFRAWDDTKKEWTLNIMECVSSGSGSIWLEPALKTHKVFIEQYTGLKDKNGKEIYEGDIMCWDNSKFSFQGHGVVMYEHGGWCVTETICTLWACITLYKAEVIGNIHESPELLGEKK